MARESARQRFMARYRKHIHFSLNCFSTDLYRRTPFRSTRAIQVMQGFRNDRNGASFIGYGLAVGLISVIALAAVQGAGSKVAEIFGSAGNSLLVPQAGSDGGEENQTPVVTVLSLSAGQSGVAYSTTLTASDNDGPNPLTWSIVSGALPSGLFLNSGTGEISGTPDTVEDQSFTVAVSDGLDSSSQELSIEIEEFVALSCLEILNDNPGASSGIHQIDIDGSATDVYCDMDSSGGGWTMVFAGFEDDPNYEGSSCSGYDPGEGIQADYDPTLSMRKTFSLLPSQVPVHTQVGFGKNKNATSTEYFAMSYSPGALTSDLAGLKGGTEPYFKVAIFDENLRLYGTPGGASTSHWRIYCRSERNQRGRVIDFGPSLFSTAEDFAWTVWVR